ncbi:metal ABC transporter solute-binding protein, Zn/Mn family [Pararhizobium haloflavum]|uniref:metal ABC transporter solute-binding protein, Zn/Mn family n=1 Tax=Pararhizobium haloflavum TaxID=2037914 RepID=UPI0018E407E5|nr:zinc ABC transporter substrate-binding protein [Pararhizobium haloflavum]
MSLTGLVLLAVGTFAAFSAGSAPARAEDKPLQIVATVSMIGDAVSRVAGDRAEVRTLMGEGVDPHLYRQTQADIAAMVRADVVFWNGLYLEAQLEEFLERLARQKPVIALGEAVPVGERIASVAYPDRFDPHIWMDPTLFRHVIEAARDALIDLDPEGASIYTANADDYLGELDGLRSYAKDALASVSRDRRVLVTAHDAFGYFGRAYDFEVVGVQGLSTESEAGLQQIDRLVDLIVEREITSIFVESSVSERNVRALIEGAAARGHEVTIGGQLFSDAMGPAGTYQGTYLGMIDANVTTITRALGGMAPEGGMAGRLVES